jgi:streptomycin 3"-adenylyltransferase
VRDVAGALAGITELPFGGLYLHGSAVLGGFNARRSDIDMLAVCTQPMHRSTTGAAAEAVSEATLPCPARGLELSIVTTEAARRAVAQPPFELHVTTAPDDTKVIDGQGHAGDPDLLLHFAVCRARGERIGPGPPAAEVFGPVPRGMVLNQLAAELAWGQEHNPTEYAVLNACRAWRFAADGAFVSKLEGGCSALSRVDGADRELITIALARQRGDYRRDLPAEAARAFARAVVSRLTSAPC